MRLGILKLTPLINRYPIFSLIGIMLCSVFAGLLFLPHQSIWVDESTQLVGLDQPLNELIPWLLNKTSNYGVPYDRSPPVSYLIGKLWCTFFGCSITSLRVMGIVTVSVGTGFIFHTAYKNVGKWAAVASGLIFAISPNIIIMENEIRSYPLFLAFSAIGLYLYTTLLEKITKKRLLLLILICFLTIFTHYYGIIYSSSIFLSLFIIHSFKRSSRDLSYVALGFGFLLICSLGLIPFIMAAHSSDVNHDTKSVVDIIKLGYRFFAHSSMTYYLIIIPLLFVSVGVVLCYCLFVKTLYRKFYAQILLPVILGLTVTVTAFFVVNSFKVTTISYSIWILPNISLLLGAGFMPASNWLVKASSSIIILCNMFGAYFLISWGSFFSHGPSEQIAQLIKTAPINTQAVIYESESDQIGMVYFPLNFLFNNDLQQYQFERPDLDGLMKELKYNSSSDLSLILREYEYVYVITVRKQNSKDIIKNLKYGVKVFPMGKVGNDLKKSPDWKLIQSPTYISMTSAQVYLFKKTISLEKQ
jgi:Dolichyl-phosphate-mannose-protein mannosyltransferase